MKVAVCSVFIFLISLGLKAQTEDLIVKSNGKGAYVEHKVASKENFYSIGREFNVHPKHIALFNGLNMTRGLSLGQVVKIPLSDTNYTHKSDKGLPVYYITSGSETVYNVSTNNNVLMERLRKWNSITNDKLPAGSKLIVGYLTSNEALAPVVNSNVQQDATTKPLATGDSKDTLKSIVSSKPEQKKEEIKADKQKVEKTQEVEKTKEETKPVAVNEGFFKESFEQQITQQPADKEQTVTAGIFKTSSGWSDTKYYVLMNGVEPGTIVRITNPNNSKSVYAKLLGDMSDLKQNDGPEIRISTAAAVALNISSTNKFVVKLNY